MLQKYKKRAFNQKLLFFCCLTIPLLLQFCVFYIYVNFNSFILAFTSYDKFTNTTTFVGMENFKDVLVTFFASEESVAFWVRLKNSVVNYLVTLFFGTGFALLFSYYIYKKEMGSGLFKVVLFLPSIVPGMALISIYRYFVETGGVSLCNLFLEKPIYSFLWSADRVYPTVLFFGVFMGFGTQVMMYLGAMSKINPSITDALKLDGASFLREFWSITLPCVYSTVITFFIVGITGIFSSDMGLYSFFAMHAPSETQTLGYYLLNMTRSNVTNREKWPFIASVGLVYTVVLAPITVALRFYLDKKDPMN